MRTSLRWALGISTIVTLAVVALSDDSPVAPPAPFISPAARARQAQVERLDPGAAAPPALSTIRPAPAAAAKALPPITRWPDTLDRQELSSATRDPFRTVIPPPPPAPVAASPAPDAVRVVPAPAVPPMSYRYLGQVTDPEGKRLILIAKGDREIAASPGTQLDDGFRVQGIQAHAVALLHVATNTPFEIRIPESDDAKSR